MNSDRQWLKKYSELLTKQNVLELGSGEGIDTSELLNFCNSVIVIESDKEKLNKFKAKYTEVEVFENDFRHPPSLSKYEINVIVASLCLQYFTKQETMNILAWLSNLLKKEEKMIVRLNSSNDINFGSVGNPEIERGLFNVNGKSKRFFNKTDIEQFFSKDWKIIDLKEISIDRYNHTKVIWEFIAEKK